MKKFVYFIAIGIVCAACTQEPIPAESLFMTEQEANQLIQAGKILHINELLDTANHFVSEKGNFFSEHSQYRARATKDYVNYLFAIDTIPVSEVPIYIRGRITTDDYAGNFYKSICIQEIVDGEQQALRLSVDAGSVGGLYQLGQEVLVRVDGLAMGRYANQPQLCVPSYNNNIYAGSSANEKVGWAPGRIPSAIFKEHVKCIGLPDKSKLHYDSLRIADFINIINLQEARLWDGKLVCLTGVHYTGQYYPQNTNESPIDCSLGDPEEISTANVFAPTTGNVGYPQGRVIEDTIDKKMTAVSTSEYAKFAHYYLPGANKYGIRQCKQYNGNITGILGFYRDNAKYQPTSRDWSITIRSLDDIDLKKRDGTPWIPSEYTPK